MGALLMLPIRYPHFYKASPLFSRITLMIKNIHSSST